MDNKAGMDAGRTIERIKKVEELGKADVELAEAEKAETIRKAREKAIVLVEEFEKTRETETQNRLSEAEKDVKKAAEKIVKKAEEEAGEMRKKASGKVSRVSDKMFGDFKKAIGMQEK